ncbi:GvpL/GvpF family gas vesicle protein [Kribbella sp. NPDC050820]|uniref:GvpL/GvpF family gas vesicle protein n=1 Tax=Kribbella sp. NPDC050820 TaxID=3155408 RepID=UPI0033F4A530
MTTPTTPGDVGLGCYLYGIVAADLVVPADLKGVGDQAVTLIPYGEVAAVTSPLDTEYTLAGRADLLAHSRVLDTVAVLGPVIPVRFGSLLQNQDAIRADLLEPDHDRFRSMLGDLAGHAQFTIRARYDEQQILTEVVAENPEIARLRAATRDQPGDAAYGERVRLGELVARALEAKSAEDGRALLTELERLVAAINVRESAGLDRLLDAALLVADDRRDEFEQAVEKLAEAYAGRAQLRLVGPTAPYDFVDVEDGWA